VARLYGEEKTKEEIRTFVLDYVERVKSAKHDRFHAIMSLIPLGKFTVLDYGCGWGHYAIAMRDKGNKVEAIDLSQNQIDICNVVWGRQENINFSAATINKFSDNSFDYVVSNQVLEHVHNVGNYLSGINRVLKSDGRLVISLPNVMNPRFFFAMLRRDLESKLIIHSGQMLKNYDKGNDHINAWDPQHFTTLMASMGFVLERYLPTEGIAMPTRKPFGSYVHLKNKRIRNLSYTMTFLFRKVNNKIVQMNE
jgi:2-polyprenyl-3-methyl-5-hydroxy-6-metoxy-1,4-benzoquinol methylase